MKRVLVTGAGGSPGINFIQALREAPEPFAIVATDINRYHLQWLDVERRYLVPPCSDPDYIEILNEIIAREGVDLVHPQPDVEVRVLSDHRHELRARTFFPAADTVRVLQDKAASADVWQRAGICRRPALVVESREDLCTAVEELGLPLWLRASTGAGARGSTVMEKVETGWHWLRYWQSRGVDWTFI